MIPISPATEEQRQLALNHYRRARRLLKEGKAEEARALLHECCLLDPAARPFRNALRDAQRSVVQRQGGIGARFRLWSRLRRLRGCQRRGDLPGVLAAAEWVLDLDPKNVEAHLALADAFEQAGMVAHAVHCLEITTADVMLSSPAFAQRVAHLHEKQGHFSAAEALTRQAEPQPPPGQPMEQELTVLRRDLEILEQRLQADPNSEELVVLREPLRREIAARELLLLRQQADRAPQDKRLRWELGKRLAEAGQWDEAAEKLTALENDPDYPDLPTLLAHVRAGRASQTAGRRKPRLA